MANIYLNSKDVTVYPSGLRSGAERSSDKLIFNPESRISTEANANSRINAITSGRSFVISDSIEAGNRVMEVALHGYVFKLTLSSEEHLSKFSNKICANIKLRDIASKVETDDYSAVYSLPSLVNIEANKSGTSAVPAPLDIAEETYDEAGQKLPYDVSDYKFYGIVLSEEKLADCDYTLCILEKDSSGNWIVPAGSWGKLTTRDIIYKEGTAGDGSDNKTLNDLLDFEGNMVATKLEPGADIWGQHFDGTADITNVPVGDSTGMYRPGTTDYVEGDIGSKLNPYNNIYASNLNIGGTDIGHDGGSVAAANQIMYLRDGIFVSGMSFSAGTTPPDDAEGNIGDFYIQYQD